VGQWSVQRAATRCASGFVVRVTSGRAEPRSIRSAASRAKAMPSNNSAGWSASCRNDPTSSYLGAASRGRGRDPNSYAGLNGPRLMRHERLILKNSARDKPFRWGAGISRSPALASGPCTLGSYGAPERSRSRRRFFFSLADNWIPGYAQPTNDTLTSRVAVGGGGERSVRRAACAPSN